MPDTTNAVIDQKEEEALDNAMQFAAQIFPQMTAQSAQLGTTPSALASAFFIAGYQMSRITDGDEFALGLLDAAIAEIKSGRPNPLQKSATTTKHRTH